MGIEVVACVGEVRSQLNVVVVVVQGKGTLEQRLQTILDDGDSCPSCSYPFVVDVFLAVPSTSSEDLVGQAVKVLGPRDGSIGVQV